jgi:hypothetical protein
MRTQVDTTQEKTKANNQPKSGKDPTQRGLMAIKNQSTITKKSFDKKVVIYHKSTSDEGALVMICGRDEEPRPSVTAR